MTCSDSQCEAGHRQTWKGCSVLKILNEYCKVQRKHYLCRQIYSLSKLRTMRKTTIILLVMAVATSVYAKKKLDITTSGESLAALTQVTDNEEPCFNPFGGDNGKDLYFTVQENKKYFNI